MWPRLSIDPIKLFDLRPSDLLCLDDYFVARFLNGAFGHEGLLREMGEELYVGLRDVPEVTAYFAEVSPEFKQGLQEVGDRLAQWSPAAAEAAAQRILRWCAWNVGMAKSPAVWDALPWSYWDPDEIHDRVDINGRTVLDMGAGTGQVTLRCAPYAERVLALEPVATLRRYFERKLAACGFTNVTTVDGVMERMPLTSDTVDVAILSNGSFGWDPDAELREIERVVRSGGTALMLAPCGPTNQALVTKIREAGYEAFEFQLPAMGLSPGFIREFA